MVLNLHLFQKITQFRKSVRDLCLTHPLLSQARFYRRLSRCRSQAVFYIIPFSITDINLDGIIIAIYSSYAGNGKPEWD